MLEGKSSREGGVGILLTVQAILELSLHDIVLLTSTKFGEGSQSDEHNDTQITRSHWGLSAMMKNYQKRAAMKQKRRKEPIREIPSGLAELIMTDWASTSIAGSTLMVAFGTNSKTTKTLALPPVEESTSLD